MDRFRQIFSPLRVFLAALFFGVSLLGLAALTVPLPDCIGQISVCGGPSYSEPLIDGTPGVWAVLLGIALLSSVVLSLTATRSSSVATVDSAE